MEFLIYTALLGALYFAPTMAAARGRRGSVLVLNLFFGWTIIGWVIALAIAVYSRETAKEVV